MRYEKIPGFLGLILAIMLITGCQIGGQEKSGSIELKEVYTGMGAVDIQWVEETIPNYEVTSPYQLMLSADLVNKGAHEITNGMIIVDGLQVGAQNFQATGRTQYQEEGYPVRVNFNPVTIQDDKQFLITACYPYKTWLKGTFCYDPEMQPSTLAKACEFKEHQTLSGGQGAPIAIMGVDIRRKGDGSQADIVIQVRNTGNGEVRSPSNPTIDCQGQEVRFEDRDKVRVNKIMFNGVDISHRCAPQPQNGFVSLYNGEIIMTCPADNLRGAGRAEQKPFEIELEYGYVTQSSIKNIRVQKQFT